MMTTTAQSFRKCLRDPIPEIADAAHYLDTAVSAHNAGRPDLAEHLIQLADIPSIRQWTESIWGKNSPYVKVREAIAVERATPSRSKRMPTAAEKRLLHERDHNHCRFCGIPVIRPEIRKRMNGVYPRAVLWGRRNVDCHAAFQAMWVQYDHIVPFTRGGPSELSNLVVTCAPCNFGRMQYTLEEVGLMDPRGREPVTSAWDGLERFSVRTPSEEHPSLLSAV